MYFMEWSGVPAAWFDLEVLYFDAILLMTIPVQDVPT